MTASAVKAKAHCIAFLFAAYLFAACGSSSGVIPPPAQPSPTAAYATLRFDIVSGQTGQPVTADITIRRERRDGSLVEDTQFFTGQKIEIEVLVDPDALLYILVEAKGYHSWEIAMRIKQASTLSGPIRLQPIAPDTTPTPGQQG